jgi:hypothetical protein
MLVVGRAAQCAAAFAQAIVAETSSHATQDRPFAAVILVDVKPHVTQTPRPVAHVNALKVLPEILPLHPEESVVLHFTAPAFQFRLLVLVPQRRRVRPIARPLELSPRVAQPQQAYSLDLQDGVHGVCVAPHQSLRRRALALILAGGARANQELLPDPRSELVDERIVRKALLHAILHRLVKFDIHLASFRAATKPLFPFVVADLKRGPEAGRVCRRLFKSPRRNSIAGESLQAPKRVAAIESVVIPDKLSECLLKQRNPQLFAVWLGEDGRVGASLNGNGIVDCHSHEPLQLSAVELQHVPAAGIVLVCQEHALDGAWVLREAGEGSHEPAITELALAYVGGLDGTREQPCMLAGCKRADVITASPLDLFSYGLLVEAFPCADRRGVGREVGILVAKAEAVAAAPEAGAIEPAAQTITEPQPETPKRADCVGDHTREDVDADGLPDPDGREQHVPDQMLQFYIGGRVVSYHSPHKSLETLPRPAHIQGGRLACSIIQESVAWRHRERT